MLNLTFLVKHPSAAVPGVFGRLILLKVCYVKVACKFTYTRLPSLKQRLKQTSQLAGGDSMQLGTTLMQTLLTLVPPQSHLSPPSSLQLNVTSFPFSLPTLYLPFRHSFHKRGSGVFPVFFNLP